MTKIAIRKPYDPSEPVRKSFLKPTRAKQSMKDECDINKIIPNYSKTGLITHVNTIQGHYGDFADVDEYQISLNNVLAAQDAFLELPAKIRARFANSPYEFVEFATNPDNLDEMRKMGLAPPAEPDPKPETIPVKEPNEEAPLQPGDKPKSKKATPGSE